MCGIFAYSGKGEVTSKLLTGLKKLEYRGYDSSGLAFFSEGKIKCFRAAGELSELEKLVSKKNLSGHLGMGHTRWATHGAATKENAHPHQAESIYVIHNGVIENVAELKKLVAPQKFSSDTDTEVIAHLIFKFYKENQDIMKSISKTMECLKGSYAVLILCEDFPEDIFAFKKGPSLILSKKKDEIVLSSDVNSLGSDTKEVLFLNDGNILHLSKNDFKVYDSDLKPVKMDFKKVDLKSQDSDKGKFPHFMLKEIFEQPTCMQNLIDKHIDQKKCKVDLKLSKGSVENLKKDILKFKSISIYACGSSYYAALYAKYVIEEWAKIKVDVEVASEFIYREVIPSSGLAIFISQSGETADTLQALNKTRSLGMSSLSICNSMTSHLARESDYVIAMDTGIEIGVASTKAFSTSLQIINLISIYLSQDEKTEESKEFIKDLLNLPSRMKEVLYCDKFFKKICYDLKDLKGFMYLGRRELYPLALEGALKLKEIAYIHAEGFPAGELKHGPLALIDQDHAAVVLLPPEGKLYKKVFTNLQEVSSRGAYVLCIGGPEEVKASVNHYLALPNSHALNTACLQIIPLQLMAYYISRSLGYNADKPRNLAKSVTVE